MLITSFKKKIDVNKGLAVGIGVGVAIAIIAGVSAFVLSTSEIDVQVTEELLTQDTAEQQNEPVPGKVIDITVTEELGMKGNP